MLTSGRTFIIFPLYFSEGWWGGGGGGGGGGVCQCDSLTKSQEARQMALFDQTD